MNTHGYPQHMSDRDVRLDQAREQENVLRNVTWEQVAAWFQRQQQSQTETSQPAKETTPCPS